MVILEGFGAWDEERRNENIELRPIVPAVLWYVGTSLECVNPVGSRLGSGLTTTPNAPVSRVLECSADVSRASGG
jgi:hypothetical protein